MNGGPRQIIEIYAIATEAVWVSAPALGKSGTPSAKNSGTCGGMEKATGPCLVRGIVSGAVENEEVLNSHWKVVHVHSVGWGNQECDVSGCSVTPLRGGYTCKTL